MICEWPIGWNICSKGVPGLFDILESTPKVSSNISVWEVMVVKDDRANRKNSRIGRLDIEWHALIDEGGGENVNDVALTICRLTLIKTIDSHKSWPPLTRTVSSITKMLLLSL